MNPPTRALLQWVLGVVVIPLGVGLWLFGIWAGFEGAGAWASLLCPAGLLLMITGAAFKAVAIVLAIVHKRRPPIWFWSDVLIFACALLFGWAWRIHETRPRPYPPPPKAYYHPQAEPRIVDRLEAVTALRADPERLWLTYTAVPVLHYDARSGAFLDADMPGAGTARGRMIRVGETVAIWGGKAWRKVTYRGMKNGRISMYHWGSRGTYGSDDVIDEELLIVPYGE